MQRIVGLWLLVVMMCESALPVYGVIVVDEGVPEGGRPKLFNVKEVECVNIVAPDGRGLSHNRYERFDVGESGVVLNNTCEMVKSELAGLLMANPNLQASGEASVILNEVTRENPSEILGFIEVNGKAADVILSNPYGISVNGGGFINVPRSMLTTGEAEFDESGALTHFLVEQGMVTIGEQGINVSDCDYFGIMAKAVELGGKIEGRKREDQRQSSPHARDADVKVVAGCNRVGMNGSVEALNNDEAFLGIDSTALGGIYGGRIELRVSGRNVGVRAPSEMSATMGDFELRSDGSVEFVEPESGNGICMATGQVQIESEHGDVEVTNGVVGSEVKVEGSHIYLKGSLQTNVGDMELKARENVDIMGNMRSAGKLDVEGMGVMVAEAMKLFSKADMKVLAREGDLRLGEGSSMNSAGTADLIAGGNILNEGNIFSKGNLLLKGVWVDNAEGSQVETEAELKAKANQLNNRGKIKSRTGDVDIDRVLNEETGVIQIGRGATEEEHASEGEGDVRFKVKSLHNEGKIRFGGEVTGEVEEEVVNAEPGVFSMGSGKFSGPGTWTNRGNMFFDGNFEFREGLFENISATFWAGGDGVFNRLVNRRERAPVVIRRIPDALRQNIGYGGNKRYSLFYDELESDNFGIESSMHIEGKASILESLSNSHSSICIGNNLLLGGEAINLGTELFSYRNNEKQIRVRTGSHISIYRWGIKRVTDYENRWVADTSPPPDSIGAIPSTIQVGGRIEGEIQNFRNGELVSHGDDIVDGQGELMVRSERNAEAFTIETLGVRDPNSLLYNVSDVNSEKPYRVETDPMLVNVNEFLGSDAALGQFDGFWGKGDLQRRYGDAYVEHQLVSDQLWRMAGRMLLPGYGDEYEQMSALYDNGVAFAREWDLNPGMKLTSKQVLALTTDILWMESIEVDGESVLVPRLYLCEATREKLRVAGSMVLAKKIDLNLSGDLENSGLIETEEGTKFVAENVRIHGGEFASGGTTKLEAREDMDIVSSKVSGDEGLDLGAKRMVARTDVQRIENEHGYTDSLGSQNVIESAEGDVKMHANESMKVAGTDVNAKNNITLRSEGTMELNTVEQEREWDWRDGENSMHEHSRNHLQTRLVGGGDVNVTSFGHMYDRAVVVDAKGFVNMDSDTGQHTQDVAKNEETKESYFKSKGGFLCGDSTEDNFSHKEEVLESQISGQKGVNIGAQKDATLVGSTLKSSEGRVNIKSREAKARLLAAEERDVESHSSVDSGMLTVTMSQKGHDRTKQKLVEIESAEKPSIEGAEGVEVDYIDKGTLESSIQELSQQPGLEYLADLQNNPNVDFEKVLEAFNEWDSSETHLSGPAKIAIALAVSIATAGAGTGAAFAGSLGLQAGAVATGVGAAFNSLLVSASVSFCDNQGDLGKVFSDLTRTEAIKSVAVAGLTAGITQGLADGLDMEYAGKVREVDGVKTVTKVSDLSLTEGLKMASLRAATQTGVQTALDGGGKAGKRFFENTATEVVSAVAAQAASRIGDARQQSVKTAGAEGINSFEHKALHGGLGALTGGVRNAIRGEDILEGAIGGATGAVVAEIVAEAYINRVRDRALKEVREELLSNGQQFESFEDLQKAIYENVATIVQSEIGTSGQLGKLASVGAALGTGLDVSSAYDASVTAIENNHYQFGVMNALGVEAINAEMREIASEVADKITSRVFEAVVVGQVDVLNETIDQLPGNPERGLAMLSHLAPKTEKGWQVGERKYSNPREAWAAVYATNFAEGKERRAETMRSINSAGLDFSFVGNIKGWQEAFTGEDLVTGETFTPGERALIAGLSSIPFVGGRVKNLARGEKLAVSAEKTVPIKQFERIDKTRVKFRDYDVLAVRDLEHLSEGELRKIAEKGVSPKNKAGSKLELHHSKQRTEGPLIEVPSNYHTTANPRQHPFPDRPSEINRNRFGSERRAYWKERAQEELERRGLK